MITVGKRPLKLDRALLAGLVAAMALALGSGCVASGDIDPETGEPLETTVRSNTEGTGHAATETANGATTPAAPSPDEPQPSPWDPGGPGYLTGESPAASPTASPTATPQPSPWHGFVPPPGSPNNGPSQITSATSP